MIIDTRSIVDLQPEDIPEADVWTGGFPCQDISVAGKGAGLDGERSGLYHEWFRLIRAVRPRVVVVENVPALLGRGMGRVLGDLASCGYDAEWDCIPASAFGAPHRRDRIWIVADANSVGRPSWTNEGEFGRQGASLAYPSVFHAQGLGNGQRQGEFRRGGWRTTLSGFCRMAHGLSKRLDGGLIHDAEKRRSREILYVLQKAVDTESFQWATGGQERVSAEEILQPKVHGEGKNQEEGQENNPALASTTLPSEGMSALRDNGKPCASPHQRESSRQPEIQPDDLVWIVSHYLALEQRKDDAEIQQILHRLRNACSQIRVVPKALSALQKAWFALSDQEKNWVVLAACHGQWVDEWPNVPRVASGIPSRVDRLKSLGNAIVPQIAEWIAGRLKAMDPTLETHSDFFAGIGGFSLGFQRAGFRTVWANEIEPYCIKVLQKNFDAEVLSQVPVECKGGCR